MRMKLLLENFKRFSTLTEDQLIIEGRIDDARKKYPFLAKQSAEPVGEKTLLDLLIDADPSGNQKYLMGAARLVVDLLDDLGYMEDGGDRRIPAVVQNFAELVQRYHKLMPFIRDQDAKFKDINAIKAYWQLREVIDRAAQKKADREAEKAREAAEKQEAIKGTEFVADTPFHKVVRPLTREGSCYFGRETRWCISATQSQNYFDQYTSDGKAFFFLLAKNKNIDPAYKKIAVVIDRNGDFEDYFDAVDDSMTPQVFKDAIRQTILGADLSGEIVSFEDDDPYDRDKIMKAAEILGVTEYIDDDEIAIENAVELIDDEVEEYIQTLQTAAGESVAQTPAGTPIEDFESKLDEEYQFNHFQVTLYDTDETGLEYVYWEAYARIDAEIVVENNPNWNWKPDVQDNPDDYEDEIQAAIGNALYDANIYPDDGEPDYQDPMEYSIRISGRYSSRGLEGFESWLDELADDDKSLTESFPDALIEKLEDEELITNPELEEKEAEAKFRASKDAEYFASQEEREKQMKLALQERKFRIKIKKS